MAAGALVFWLFDALPFQDLPAHAGLIALRHRIASSAFDRHFFVFAPHLGPYSLFRGLGEALVTVLGPLGSVRALATLPGLAIPLALLWSRRRLYGDRTATTGYIGVALSFGFMTMLGFASFLLGVALLVVGLTLWLELLATLEQGERSAWKREAGVAAAAVLLFVAHGDAFALYLALAVACALGGAQRLPRLVRLRAFGPALLFAAWVAWQERPSALPAGSVAPAYAAPGVHFQGALDKLSLLVTPTLLSRTGLDIVVGIALWTVLGAGVIATARFESRLETPHVRPLLWSLVTLAGAFVLLPHSIGWFGFVDGRLLTPLLLVAALAVRRESFGRRLALTYESTAVVGAIALVGLALVGSGRFQAEARGWAAVSAHVPPGARLLNLPLDPNSDVFTAHPFVHYDKLILAERPIVVSDTWFHQGSALYPTAAHPALRLPPSYSESYLREVDWARYALRDWDYVLVRTRPNAEAPRVPEALRLVVHEGGWWLFRTR